jgi:hypothetical protein
MGLKLLITRVKMGKICPQKMLELVDLLPGLWELSRATLGDFVCDGDRP